MTTAVHRRSAGTHSGDMSHSPRRTTPAPAPGAAGKLDRLRALLREMFQLDRGDLDFGLYRIMNLKSAEILIDGPRYHLKLTVLNIKTHAYYPLLHADRDCKVTIQPVALDGNEKTVVEALNDLAQRIDFCLQGAGRRVLPERCGLLPETHPGRAGRVRRGRSGPQYQVSCPRCTTYSR